VKTLAPEFSLPVEIAGLPPSGRHYRIAATTEERTRVAARIGVTSIDRLEAELDVRAAAGGVIRVQGTVEADLVQSCVVTLQPVPARIREQVAVAFAEPRPAARHAHDAEEVVELEDEDPPEIATEGRIDLGEVAVAQIVLGLDPYPRAPGAAFDPKLMGRESQKTVADSPFAALAKLKKGP
jgi:uncharacterized metal-binding protein YceD (DUF177 family)